ncbi:MAG: hypothetical protein EOM76_00760 [Sphingobacteriia bacterium]|jgi:hypothetical protein|nr:hypothetical protein [Sphingobacteriia bacterium]
MLHKILSISGKPGLFKLVSQSKNMIIVESLLDGKRKPSYSNDKVISLEDVAVFSDSGEIRLGDVFEKIKQKENGKKITVDVKSDPETLRAYFAAVLPDFDRDRVYPTDIKKIIIWYNLLLDNGLTDFTKPESEQEEKA